MKKVIAYSNYTNSEFEAWFLESEKDLEEYAEFIKITLKSVVQKILKFHLPMDRFGHFLSSLRPEEEALVRVAYNKALIHGGNLMFFLEELCCEKLNLISRMLISNPILINMKGGLQPFDDGLSVKKSMGDKKMTPTPYCNIRKSTHLVLENDWLLERKAKKYLENFTYSYITELRLLDKDSLTKLMEQFVELGGHTLYVYTTASDIKQMYFYLECALNAKIKKFKFQWSANPPNKVKDVIDWLKEATTNVTIIDN